MQLIYRGTRDGFSKPQFLNKCEGKKNTLTICLTLSRGNQKHSIVGGFMDEEIIN